ncbi:hypothetical protein BIV04_01690 [Frigoribacterium sp. MCBA15_019]|nr:hypothetical protein BIV04_01690 [Frigoribacterium sp. MCBA15_019]
MDTVSCPLDSRSSEALTASFRLSMMPARTMAGMPAGLYAVRSWSCRSRSTTATPRSRRMSVRRSSSAARWLTASERRAVSAA